MTDQSIHRRYPDVPSQADYPALEEATLAYWEKDGTFAASIEMRPSSKTYTFNDGPPFANGLPHYGHLLTGFVKDAMPRYHTMRGARVERNFGWDCHGLPAETEAEKELGVSGRGPITAFGIDRFNDYCRTSVLRYVSAWKRYVTRQARWVDFENDYKTMDITYMESVLWAFKELSDRGLIYEAYRVLPYCWECETPLSISETRLDDAYRERVDPAVTVAFRLHSQETATPRPSDGELRVLVWTTTPWTLPSNLALAVGGDITYAVVESRGVRYLCGKDRLEAYADDLGPSTVLETLSGAELKGRRYEPLLSYATPVIPDLGDSLRVLVGDFVSTDEGTGIVHLAPGFGEDDQMLCEANGIVVFCPVDSEGCFNDTMGDLAGIQVFEANDMVIEHLKANGALLRREDYAHSYPHCWRTDTPLIYRAVSSYFVEVSAIKDRLIALNDEVNWVPAHVKDGAFGKWLEGARDWSISRNRFWGAPIPVWKSDDPAYPRVDVYGSLEELEADFGVRPTDLHRPAIDELTRPNPDDPSGKSTMRRISDVLDCWFESGSMPFAQLHYPFEGAEALDSRVPADFICEYIGQTRAWFYYQHVLATALFDRPAFSNVIAHGIVLGDDGRKLSKRLQNFPDPEEFFSTGGADTMRWSLLSSPVLRGQDLVIEKSTMAEPVRQVLNPIWNTWHFLSLYASTDDVCGTLRTDASGILDRYILAKSRVLISELTSRFDTYDLAGACGAVTRFLDALTNWYVRRSRERFWRPFGEDPADNADKRDAYDTLHSVLTVVCRCCAPLLPLLTENVYRGLTGARSVHLTNWPDEDELPQDDALVEGMDLVREICSAAHSIRKARGLRARLPLEALHFAGARAKELVPYLELIKDEVNVKHVELSSDPLDLASASIQAIPSALGPRLGPKTQLVIDAIRKGEWSKSAQGTVQAGGITLNAGEFVLALRAKDADAARILSQDEGVVALDTAVTPELAREGVARDVVRLVQQARKDAGLEVIDRITLVVHVTEDLAEELAPFSQEIGAQILALKLTYVRMRGVGDVEQSAFAWSVLPDGRSIGLEISRINT
jgi:isoleucyl-tRNA synthetase